MTPLPRLTAATADVLRVLVEDDGAVGGVWGMLVITRTGRPAGSVYPILERLEGAGWVSSTWESATDRSGPRRRLYRLTADGAGAARDALARIARRTRPTRRSAAPGAAAPTGA